jgi:rSAM/selenodomain-associated transferase 1
VSKNLVIVFAREPIKGSLKTRLASTFGKEKTLLLYKCFINDIIDTLKSTQYEFKIAGYPDVALINSEFGDYNNFIQESGNLGDKMKNAFNSQFELGYENIVLIGSDTPHIPKGYFEEAFGSLQKNDLILGPSLDGGYYLIAFNKYGFNEKIFDDITWSTSVVLRETLAKSQGKKVHLLKELNDIDTQEDLEEFYNQYKDSYFKSSNTINFLKEHK